MLLHIFLHSFFNWHNVCFNILYFLCSGKFEAKLNYENGELQRLMMTTLTGSKSFIHSTVWIQHESESNPLQIHSFPNDMDFQAKQIQARIDRLRQVEAGGGRGGRQRWWQPLKEKVPLTVGASCPKELSIDGSQKSSERRRILTLYHTSYGWNEALHSAAQFNISSVIVAQIDKWVNEGLIPCCLICFSILWWLIFFVVGLAVKQVKARDRDADLVSSVSKKILLKWRI